jgi:phosphoribosyl 1,2-cyclic phosphodiesterase
MLDLCVLASGSGGNAIYVASPSTAILVDDGISARSLLDRCARVGIDPARISAVCLTHEHTDHVSGIRSLRKRFPDLALYANAGTIEALHDADRALPWTAFAEGFPFPLGDLRITAFPIPHDAAAAVGFVIEDADSRIGICTDLGIPTENVRYALRGCNALVLEANHDEWMLQMSRRPWSLRQRIAGRLGHLSNDTSAKLLLDVAGDTLTDVFLAHLSSECNTPDTVASTFSRILAGHPGIAVHLTYQDKPAQLHRCTKRNPQPGRTPPCPCPSPSPA